MRCALVGDQLAALAQKNGWEGVVVYGCIRDSGEINATDIGFQSERILTGRPRQASQLLTGYRKPSFRGFR